MFPRMFLLLVTFGFVYGISSKIAYKQHCLEVAHGPTVILH